MSEATMAPTGPEPTSAATTGPVGHTDARHVALLSVGDGTVSYDREHAAWTVRTAGARKARPIRGAEQRTLRDLLDFGLIDYREQPGAARVRLTPRGRGALALWGERSERLEGMAETAE
jgi:hypothetical protein